VDKSSIAFPTGRVLQLIATDENLAQLELVTRALANDKRLAILQLLGNHTCSLIEIAEALDLPQSTATQHITILKKAGLVKTDLQAAKRGLQKMCARVYDQVILQLPANREGMESVVEVSMPLGAYTDVQASPTCGLAGEIGIIGQFDTPGVFFEPERIYAQLLWFHKGYVEYRFPNHLPPGGSLTILEVAFEVCSEAPLHHPDWPSDITLWMNGQEIGTWTSPADFGGERGALTPSWWDLNNTQYGLLKVWKIAQNGSYVDGMKVSDVCLADLRLKPAGPISVRIGIKDNAANVGGINLFGRKFGNYPQDIILRQHYKRISS
jgi:predicted transcriptional regulator